MFRTEILQPPICFLSLRVAVVTDIEINHIGETPILPFVVDNMDVLVTCDIAGLEVLIPHNPEFDWNGYSLGFRPLYCLIPRVTLGNDIYTVLVRLEYLEYLPADRIAFPASLEPVPDLRFVDVI